MKSRVRDDISQGSRNMSSLTRLFIAACLLSACAPASRFVQHDKPPAAIDVRGSASGALRVTVAAIIGPDQPGSWVKEAAWDELSIVLASREGVTVESLEIASALPANAAHSASRNELEGRSRANIEAWQALGTVGGTVASVVGTSLMGAAALATGSAVAGVTAIVALPVIVIGAPVHLIRKSMRESEDRALIEAELGRRAVVLPLRVAPGTPVRGSAFFALTPDPRRLVVTYRQQGRLQKVEIALPAR